MLRAEFLLLALAACSLAAPGDEELVGSCDDGIKNGNETAVDCGGPAGTGCGAVRLCPVGQACQAGTDCVSGVCEGSTCGEGDCFDGFENGDESDVDCGGNECELCAAGKKCRSELDC